MSSLDERREVWYLWDSDQLVTNVHPAAYCSGVCVVHRPSKHPMRHLALGFSVPKKAFYRVCEHGETHQDPDERTYWTRQFERSVARGRKAGGGGSAAVLAMEKLSNWACPNCSCGCCDITKLD